MDVTTNIEKGNVGEIQVIIEQNACQDMVGHENVKAESTIRVDKQAPILISLEAYTNSNIQINEAVDTVKEYYKDGDKITIIATFNENIEDKTTIAPKLTLQFSESGNAKSKVSEGVIEGNKITYTYTVTSGDEGILTVKGFNGKVLDAAENETIVTKRTLDGDTIITDTTAPKLTGITAIAPNFEYDELLTNPKDIKRYGIQSKTRENNTIVIITTYSEDVFNLNSNILNGIDDNNKPILKLKFGNSDERTATFNKVEGNKIYYTYNITSGDNGDLANINITGNVYDKAGNNLNLTTSSTLPSLEEYEESIVKENKIERITADTTKPSFTITASAINKDENGNTIQSGNFYRKGSIITIIASTNEYSYKNNNKNLELFTNSTAPKLNIGFETNGTGTGECTNVEYKDNKTIFTYTYKVQENNNGELNLNIAENQCYDIALNGNNIKTQTVAEITADTVYPVTNWQSWIENEKYGIVDNQNGSWRVTFSEELYEYDINTHTVGSRLSNSNKSSAPILLVSSDNKTPLETVISNIEVIDNKTVITYTYNPYTKNLGAYGIKFASISDRAGNLFNYKDQEAPILSNIKVTDPVTGTYKAGQKITIVVTFNEKVTGTAPVLKLKFGETSAKGSVSTGEIVNNTITYTYTITDGDNGKLAIESYTGTGLTDLYDNVWVAPTNVTLEGNQITADTIAPTVVITSDVERTNKETITYTFTWSEPVKDFTIGDVEVANGSKGKWTSVSSTVYTLEVDVTGEGRQIIKVNANVCTDIAGNPNSERVTYNKVIVDTIAPEIRAKINGGSYAINTDTNKSTIKEIVVVNEELSKFEYVWSTETSQPTTGWQTVNVNTIEVNGDIPLTTQVDNEGTYYLYIKITDLAGNTLNKRTKGYEVNKSTITFAPNITQETEENVIVKVEYGNALIKNRKAGIQGKTQSADSTIVILSENGTVYAEATDIAGNKVYNTIEITNIKKSSQNDTNTDIDIVFEDLTTIQKNGEKYVKVSPEYTTQQLTEKINQKTLNGKTPEYNNLTTDNKLKTGSTITIDGTTKYIIIVNGDVNCDGKVEFLSDIVMINNYRIGQNRNLNTIQLLAGDINNSGAIEFIPDIVAMNNYRLGRVSVL